MDKQRIVNTLRSEIMYENPYMSYADATQAAIEEYEAINDDLMDYVEGELEDDYS